VHILSSSQCQKRLKIIYKMAQQIIQIMCLL
jgi:hypothetical protein